MLRISLGVVLGVLVSNCSTHETTAPIDHSESKALPGFTFRGLVPGVTTQEDAEKAGTVNGCTSSCMFAKSTIGATPAGISTVVFKGGRFDWFAFDPDSRDYDALLVELTKVYGEPCATSSESLRNAMGAKFDGDAARWCFKEGNLTLRRHSSERNARVYEGDLEFFTAHPEPEPVTYTSETL